MILIDQEKLLEELSEIYPDILNSDGSIVPFAIIDLPEKFRAKLLKDFNIAIEVVEYDGEMLQYLCHEFKNNQDIVSVAALNGGLEYADSQLKKNKEFALEILNASDHYMLEHNFHCFAENVQNDIEILSLFLGKGFSLDDNHHSITLETAQSIVQQNGMWIEHLPKESRERKEVILQALKNNPGAAKFISGSALEDESFHLKLLSLQIIKHFAMLPVEYLSSRTFIIEAVSRCGLVLKLLKNCSSYASDEEIVLAAVKQNGWSLQYADNSLRDEKEIVVAAVTQNGLAIKFASDSLKKDEELIDLAIRNDYFAIKYVGLSLKRKKEILNNLIEISNEILGKSSQAEYLSKHPNSIDLNKSFIQNGAETFMIKVSGDSMINANIFDQSILIVDRSTKPKHDSIVVASLDGEFVCKRLQLKPELCLLSENPQYQPIYVQDGQVLDIQGTVTASINQNL
jgi:DNA polymerase V